MQGGPGAFLAGWTEMRKRTIVSRGSFEGALTTARVIQQVVEATSTCLATRWARSTLRSCGSSKWRGDAVIGGPVSLADFPVFPVSARRFPGAIALSNASPSNTAAFNTASSPHKKLRIIAKGDGRPEVPGE